MVTNSTIKQRIETFIKTSGIRVSSFEKAIGVSNGYLRRLVREPSIEKIDNILRAYPDLNRDWLLYGTGEMLSSDNQERATVPVPAIVDGVSPAMESKCREVATELEARIADICARTMAEQCQRILDHAMLALQTSQEMMKSVTSSVEVMASKAMETKEIYDKLHEVQQEHIAKSRAHLDQSIETIKKLRAEIFRKIDEQTEETERSSKSNMYEIIQSCKTFDGMIDIQQMGSNINRIVSCLEVKGEA